MLSNFIVLDENYELHSAEILRDILDAVEGRGKLVALSGGSTPEPTYKALDKLQLDWEKIVFLQVDERYVESSSPRSNARMIKQSLTHGTFFPMDTSLEPEEVATNYAEVLDEFLLKLDKIALDLVVLGMGLDGHTASVFPDIDNFETYIKKIEKEKVVAHHVPSQSEYRITLTPSFLRLAKNSVVLLRGKEKGRALAKILESGNDMKYPILQCVTDNTIWILDDEAYQALKWN